MVGYRGYQLIEDIGLSVWLRFIRPRYSRCGRIIRTIILKEATKQSFNTHSIREQVLDIIGLTIERCVRSYADAQTCPVVTVCSAALTM